MASSGRESLIYLAPLLTDHTAGSIISVDVSATEVTATWSAAELDSGVYILSCESEEHSINVTETAYFNATCDDLTPGMEYTLTVISIKNDSTSVEFSPVTIKTSK